MEKTYTRPKSLQPLQSGFCPGCLHGTASKIISEVIDELQQAHNALLVLPVGCATMGLLYWKVDMIGSAHGRAPAVATGAKRSHPSSLVFTYQGDGDLAAIGLGELIKELKSPAFVARYALNTPQNIRKARAGIKKAFSYQLEEKGFSFVELLTNCPTNWGLTPLQSLEYMQNHTIPNYPLGVFKDKEAKE